METNVMETNGMKRILIVDDYQSNVMLLKTILKDKNFMLDTAYNGNEALQKVDSFNPDVILLDIMMPGTDGYEVVEKIRSKQQYSHISIVLITALNSERNVEKGLSLGANYYLVKPFSVKELLSIVDKCIG